MRIKPVSKKFNSFKFYGKNGRLFYKQDGSKISYNLSEKEKLKLKNFSFSTNIDNYQKIVYDNIYKNLVNKKSQVFDLNSAIFLNKELKSLIWIKKMRKFKVYNTIAKEEMLAVNEVMKTGVLSKFLASPGKDFNGGPQVLKFEDAIKKYFNVKYALTLNSWTSGLIASIGALDVSPGDEIIVTTWSMCASATAIVHWNCIPVFADIDPKLII